MSATVIGLCLPTFARERTTHESAGHRPPPPPLPTFEALDTDGDHRLSEEEIAAAAEVLRKLDKNGDGEIEPHEVAPKGPHGERPDMGPPPPPFGHPPNPARGTDD